MWKKVGISNKLKHGLISENKSKTASNSTSYHNTTSDTPPQDSCKAWFDLGFTTNAVYNLEFGSNPSGAKAWCDMENGGYTVGISSIN